MLTWFKKLRFAWQLNGEIYDKVFALQRQLHGLEQKIIIVQAVVDALENTSFTPKTREYINENFRILWSCLPAKYRNKIRVF